MKKTKKIVRFEETGQKPNGSTIGMIFTGAGEIIIVVLHFLTGGFFQGKEIRRGKNKRISGQINQETGTGEIR